MESPEKNNLGYFVQDVNSETVHLVIPKRPTKKAVKKNQKENEFVGR